MEQYHQQNTLEAVSQEQVAEEELIVPRRTTTEVVFRHEVVDKQVVVPRKSKRIQIQDSLYIALLGSEGKNGEYSQFFSDLGSLLASGHSMAHALMTASKDASPKLREICVAASLSISQGALLSEALMPHQSQLPEILIPTLQAGERQGSVSMGIERLRDTFKKSVDVGHRFDSSVLSFPAIFGLEGSAWSASTHSKLNTAKKIASSPKYVVPVLGLSFRSAAGARWARSFAANWENGIPVSQALELSAVSVRNRAYASALLSAAARTRNGWSLKDSLAHVEWLPPNLLNYMETGELTGDFEVCLNQLAIRMEDDAKVFMGKAVVLAIFGPLFIVALICAVIGFGMAWSWVAEFERSHPEFAKPYREALDRYRTTGK